MLVVGHQDDGVGDRPQPREVVGVVVGHDVDGEELLLTEGRTQLGVDELVEERVLGLES